MKAHSWPRAFLASSGVMIMPLALGFPVSGFRGLGFRDFRFQGFEAWDLRALLPWQGLPFTSGA